MNLTGKQILHSDYIVVGAGSAGCVLASRLSEGGERTVTTIEAGGRYSKVLDPPLPGMWAWLRRPGRYAWDQSTVDQPHLGNRRIWCPTGKIVGGSSSINAMIYNRGHRKSFDSWRRENSKVWSYEGVLPYFKKAEHQERGESEYHGTGGPVAVSDSRYTPEAALAFLEGCTLTGIPSNSDFNGRHQAGAGIYQVTQANGRRSTSAIAYLAPALKRDNLTLFTRAEVQRILFEGDRAVGVEFLRDGKMLTVLAKSEVILSAGAFRSPHLLLLSGIGPAGPLEALGIPVVRNLPGVGRNLQDHLRLPVIYASQKRRPDSPFGLFLSGFEYLSRHRGLLTSNLCDAGAIVRTNPGVEYPDLQFVLHWRGLAPYPAQAVDLEICLLRPESQGSISLRTKCPKDGPIIDPGYLSAETDMRTLLSGIQLAREIAATKPMRGFGLGRELSPGLRTKPAALCEYVRQNVNTCYHPTGTCRMGNRVENGAVVDPDLKVHGVRGLRVADASVMPKIVTGNTNASAIMLGEKAADLIRLNW